jgi:hypothetical protein
MPRSASVSHDGRIAHEKVSKDAKAATTRSCKGRLSVDGKVLITINETDDRLFVDDNLSATSFKFIDFF